MDFNRLFYFSDPPPSSLAEFQLEHMSRHLRLERPTEGDSRVPFIPDNWQRKLFDVIG